jgi:bifunctional non-homologous end joining protein LigD
VGGAQGRAETKGQRRLAVQVEDHPVPYMGFEGTIGKGRYGAGRVAIWDAGDYDLEKWEEDKIVVDLHGKRLTGRYALIRTDGKNWLIHRTR